MTLALVSEDREAALLAWRAVDPESLPGQWVVFAALLRRALLAGDGSFSERDVLFTLLSGQSQLWSFNAPNESPISICITEVVPFPQQRKCLVRYIAGEWEPFAKNLHMMVAYAQGQGCQKIEAYMRKGLTRKLPPDWTVRHVLMVKEL